MSDSAAEIIAEYDSLIVNAYCAIAACVLIFYEYVITLSQEVDLFWTSRFNGASILFFVNRYVVLLVYLLNISGFASMSDKWAIGFSAFQYIPWAVFSGLRAFALAKYRFLAVLVFLLSLVPGATVFAYFRFNVTGANIPILGCTGNTSIPHSLITNRNILKNLPHCRRYPPYIHHLVFFANEVGPQYVSYRQKHVRERINERRVLLFMNTLHLVFTVLTLSHPFDSASDVVQFIEPMTAILVSRFLLRLQHANRKASRGGEETTRTTSQMTTIIFEHVIGSLSASIGTSTTQTVDDEQYDLDELDHKESGRAGVDVTTPQQQRGKGKEEEVA